MKNVLKKGIAFTIAMILGLSNANMQSFVVRAEETANEERNLETKNTMSSEEFCEPEVVEEVVSDRTADSTTFLLSNGMKQTTYYSDDIYFTDEKGKLSEYDNELVKLDKNDKKEVLSSVEVNKNEKDKYKYVNKEGDSKQFLPNKLSGETPVVMTKDSHVLSSVQKQEKELNLFLFHSWDVCLPKYLFVFSLKHECIFRWFVWSYVPTFAVYI